MLADPPAPPSSPRVSSSVLAGQLRCSYASSSGRVLRRKENIGSVCRNVARILPLRIPVIVTSARDRAACRPPLPSPPAVARGNKLCDPRRIASSFWHLSLSARCPRAIIYRRALFTHRDFINLTALLLRALSSRNQLVTASTNGAALNSVRTIFSRLFPFFSHTFRIAHRACISRIFIPPYIL